MIYLLLLAPVLAYLLLEKRLHDRRLRRIPLRIHVNGTRGKTAVTRLAAELFRDAGIRTLAKTTGDGPILHRPDGAEAALPRRGPASIREQMRVIRMAAAAGVDAVVLECMALAPQLQDTSETAMLRSTVGVITNVRPDHYEVMGPSVAEAAAALVRTIPKTGVLVCGADCPMPVLRDAAARLGARVVRVDALSSVCDPVLAENLAVVGEIGRQAGIPPESVEAALQRMTARGAMGLVRRVRAGGGEIALVDAFSANDPVSTATLTGWAVKSQGADLPRPWVALLNARSDRPLRTAAFAAALAGVTLYNAVAVTGSGTLLARRRLKKAGSATPVFAVPGGDPARLLAAVAAGAGSRSFTLFGLGNHRGAGAALRRHFSGDFPCC
jgi:poly-gamma-glutamate synthase PgsB/CapB